MRMQQEQSVSTIVTPRLAPLPLAVAYIAVPLGMALVRITGPGTAPSPFLPWVILAGLGVVWAMLFRRSGVRVKKRFWVEVGVFLGLIVMLFFRQQEFSRQMELLIPVAAEGFPVIMLGFCWLWVITFGIPDRAAFQRYGALLGVLCIIDLCVEITMYQAVPTVRWLGNCDVLAGLLLISLCASLKPGESDEDISEPDQGRKIWRVLILLGLAACLSRTGLFGGAWIFLCFGRGSRLTRVAVSLAFFLLLGLTFLLPTTASDAIRYIEYWLWAKSVTLIAQDPSVLIFGRPLDLALPFVLPPELGGIWERATGSLAVLGVYLPQVQSFWLRMLLGWGAVLPLLGLIALLSVLFGRMTRMGAGLVAALFAQGMSTPLMYDPATGAMVGLALLLALEKPMPVANPLKATGVDEAVAVDDQTPESEPDPAVEWNMRPL